MLNLKGIWIPIEILTDKNLSDKEKHIYSLVIFLSQEKQYCFCTNKTISKLLNISVTQVSKLVNSLKDKGYINIKIKYKENSKEIENREIIPVFEKIHMSCSKEQIPVVKNNKDIINNIKNKYNNIINQNRRFIGYKNNDFKNEDFSKFYIN